MWVLQELASGDLRGSVPTLFFSAQWNRDTAVLASRATNTKFRATAFSAGSAEAFQRQASAQCMSLREWFDVLTNHSDMLVAYNMATLVPGVALQSSDFKDGMVLTTAYRTSPDKHS